MTVTTVYSVQRWRAKKYHMHILMSLISNRLPIQFISATLLKWDTVAFKLYIVVLRPRSPRQRAKYLCGLRSVRARANFTLGVIVLAFSSTWHTVRANAMPWRGRPSSVKRLLSETIKRTNAKFCGKVPIHHIRRRCFPVGFFFCLFVFFFKFWIFEF